MALSPQAAPLPTARPMSTGVKAYYARMIAQREAAKVIKLKT